MKSIWIARDKDGMLCAYNKKPDRYAFEGIWQPENGNVSNCGVLDGDWFPEVTWENSPIELVPKIMIDKNTSLEVMKKVGLIIATIGLLVLVITGIVIIAINSGFTEPFLVLAFVLLVTGTFIYYASDQL